MSRTPRPDPLGSDEPERTGKSGQDNGEILDLCTTCNSMDLCLGKKTLKRPIHFCEEFDDYAPPPPRRPLRAVRERKKENGGYTGLCINCDNRRTCINALGEGGIWHCENYA